MTGPVLPSSCPEDELYAPEIGAWGRRKYLLVNSYCRTFATAMKFKWDARVYIDLFAGAGKSRTKDTHRLVYASPLLALQIEDPFDRYVFCEQNGVALDALRQRIARLCPTTDVRYVEGDVNADTARILSQFPRYSRVHRVLALCFADPYKLANLAFETISALAERLVDFLILIPTDMDANRNVSRYVATQSTRIERFLGDPHWRHDWKAAQDRRESFGIFLADHFGRRMHTLGYIHPGIKGMPLVRSTDKNLPLYRLALFSRNKLGTTFWTEAQKYSDPQLGLL